MSESQLDGAMFAHMAPCSKHDAADGVVRVLVDRAADGQAPPPPPSVRTRSLRHLSDRTVRGLTEAVCASQPDPVALCARVANVMSSPVPLAPSPA